MKVTELVQETTLIIQGDGSVIEVPEGMDAEEWMEAVREERYHSGLMTEEEAAAFNKGILTFIPIKFIGGVDIEYHVRHVDETDF